jgi:glycosyltransferase involved in cell wall biosynthesis
MSRATELVTPIEGPLVTVVVPARNEEQAIDACLRSIRAQDATNLEILVVDGASTDRTVEVVERHSREDPRVRVIDNPDRIIPAGLNRALREARGDFLVRVDAHAAVPPEYVRLAVDRLRSGRWGGVGGRKDGVGTTMEGMAIARAMASPFGVGNSTYHYGTTAVPVDHIPFGAYPTHLARELGGWDERLVVNQDFEFDYRVRAAGFELLFDPELRIAWESRQSLLELFRQYRRYGRGKVRVAALHPRSLAPRHLAAPALVAWVTALFVTRGRARRVVALAGGVPYLTALSAASVAAGRDLPVRARAAVPAAFVTMHLAWGMGFWAGVGRLLGDRIAATAARAPTGRTREAKVSRGDSRRRR